MVTVKVLGPGCEGCRKLFDTARDAIVASGVEAEISKVESLDGIMDYGVMRTPALVVDERVRSAGPIPTAARIVGWLQAAKGSHEASQ